ncbi:GDP-fucose transporter 1-like [Panonychus citri]|uniref:GDP-fucose transporter 1-like n=1 Tax=Panonychus citri TaxID=50023 RepID=UPI002306F8E2|nr:GDP-fucose transporter 1-like [Panonychus citri]
MTLQQPLLEPIREKSLTSKYIEITLVVALYWIVSISMVFINKHILSDKSVNFDAPLFITFYQCLCTIIFCLICNCIGHLRPSWIHWLGFPKLHLRPAVIRKVFPLSIVFVGMITMNNLCLKYVGVAFYFVGRSLTTVFNVILTYFILKEITSIKAILCCIIIIIGFIIGVDQESLQGSLTITGIFFGIAASFFVSLNSIFTKSVLPAVDGNIWLLNFYNNVNALILFTILITINGELPVIYGYQNLTSLQFWSMMTLSGLLAVSIGFVTGLQIKVTSPLTHNISGTAKACAQTVLACIWYHEEKSFIWWFSNLLVIFGSAAYTRVKQLEMSLKHSLKRQPSEP